MSYRVEIKVSAQKELMALPSSAKDRVISHIDALAENPRPSGCKKLTGAEKAYRIRIGDYRVVYEIENRVLVVLIVRIAHRREVYR